MASKTANIFISEFDWHLVEAKSRQCLLPGFRLKSSAATACFGLRKISWQLLQTTGLGIRDLSLNRSADWGIGI